MQVRFDTSTAYRRSDGYDSVPLSIQVTNQYLSERLDVDRASHSSGPPRCSSVFIEIGLEL
jgi:hypothetical protein